jgi:hypothetical protein
MAGFFGLFSGKKNKYVDEPDTNKTQNSEKKAFFLSDDEAKTYGDIDFMRQSKKVRRTFPKTLGSKGKGAELVQEISSVDKVKLNANQTSLTKNSTSSAAQSESQPIPNQPATPRRSASSDNSLDMFRKMAKELKK